MGLPLLAHILVSESVSEWLSGPAVRSSICLNLLKVYIHFISNQGGVGNKLQKLDDALVRQLLAPIHGYHGYHGYSILAIMAIKAICF